MAPQSRFGLLQTGNRKTTRSLEGLVHVFCVLKRNKFRFKIILKKVLLIQMNTFISYKK